MGRTSIFYKAKLLGTLKHSLGCHHWPLREYQPCHTKCCKYKIRIYGSAHEDSSKEKLLWIPCFVPQPVLSGTTSILSMNLRRLKMWNQPLGQQCLRGTLGAPHASGPGDDNAAVGSAKAGTICFLICSGHQIQQGEPGPHANRLPIHRQEHRTLKLLSSHMCNKEQIWKQP